MLTEEKFKKEVLSFIAQKTRHILEKVNVSHYNSIEEIRLRGNKPIMLQNHNGDYFIANDGNLTKSNINSIILSQDELTKTLELMTENSVYAFIDEVKNGFLTLRGGHRVGITGRIVLDGNSIRNIKDISGLNIRISKEFIGCSTKVLRYIINSNSVYNTLIISPPQCGKTTILRDIVRILSDGTKEFNGIKVGVVDERSEIAACYKGIPQNQIGARTDVLDGCPKQIGVMMLLRSMSPNVIVTDEIGNSGDKDAILQVINAGVKVITTAHGFSIEELRARKEILNLINERVFERYIILSNINAPGTIEEVYDGITNELIFKRKQIC